MTTAASHAVTTLAMQPALTLADTPTWLTAQNLVSFLVVAVILHVILGTITLLIYIERKLSAYCQDRIGPNRVGFDFGLPFMPKIIRRCWGLGQSLADGIKLFLKEDYTPERVDKVLFTLAPAIIVIPALMAFAIIPWGGTWICPSFRIPLVNWAVEGGPVQVQGLVVNIGIVYVLAVAAVGVYGVTLGGWASNNKYAFLGGLRATAQMISYEIPMGLMLLAALLVVGSLLPDQVIRHQVSNGWLLFSQPIAAVIFLIALIAEANRAPFDNPECEQELVGGYHTEYTSMRFGLFMLAEYAHLINASAFFSLIFLGGYQIPGIPGLQPDDTHILAVLFKFGVYMTKIILMISFIMLIRWTIPRLRFDQVMSMAWGAVIPISLLVVVATSFMVYFGYRGLIPMLIMNLGLIAIIFVFAPLFPRSDSNRRLAIYGSRFSPMEGELVSTGPTHAMAREDRPVEGTIDPVR